MSPRAAGWDRVTAMTLESVAALVVSVALLAYLVYAMLKPEKF